MRVPCRSLGCAFEGALPSSSSLAPCCHCSPALWVCRGPFHALFISVALAVPGDFPSLSWPWWHSAVVPPSRLLACKGRTQPHFKGWLLFAGNRLPHHAEIVLYKISFIPPFEFSGYFIYLCISGCIRLCFLHMAHKSHLVLQDRGSHWIIGKEIIRIFFKNL